MKLLLIFTLLAISLQSFAEPRSVSTNITSIRPYTSGSFFVQVATDQMNNNTVNGVPTCSLRYKVQNSSVGADEVVASLLLAFAQNRNVQIEIPTGNDCSDTYVPIQSVILSQ